MPRDPDEGTRTRAAQQYLSQAHVAKVLEKGFALLMEQDMLDDLARMYRLYRSVGAQDWLRSKFRDFVKKTGLSIVMDEGNNSTMVVNLLALKAKSDQIWEKAFLKDDAFGHTLKDSFESFINERRNKPAELLAKFLDSKLGPCSKKETVKDMEGLIDKVMAIFRFLSSKDVFEAFYQKDLAVRLLLGKSASLDDEQTVVSKIKAQCGPQFSATLERMLKDIDLSRDLLSAFRESEESRDGRMGDVDLNVLVLRTGTWPKIPLCDLQMPVRLSNHQDVFRSFYLRQYPSRRLTWLPSVANCVLRADFPKGRKELVASLYQTVILLLFNDADEIGYRHIRDHTGIDEADLKLTLHSLTTGNVRLLKKRPQGRNITEDAQFAYGFDFSHKGQRRIKIDTIQTVQVLEGLKRSDEKIAQDRGYALEAAIVRIMKEHKSLSDSDLLRKLLAIPVRSVDLTKRLESLIEKGYIARDKTNPLLYHYVA